MCHYTAKRTLQLMSAYLEGLQKMNYFRLFILPYMQQLKAIFTLIRFPNLLFILITQWLVYTQIISPSVLSEYTSTTFGKSELVLFVLSTVLIAAAGYIINDYFDIGIDVINKPQRVTIEKIFKRRTIIIAHVLLNLVAICMAGYLAFTFLKLRLIGLQLLSILLLYVYSTTFKRRLIIGNLMIAFLNALTLVSLAFYEPKFNLFSVNQLGMQLFWVYVLFAFLITWIREIVKDIEDLKGDTSQNCRTIPLVFGITKAKQIICFFLVVLMILLLFTFFNLFFTHKALVFFLLSFVFIPLIYIFYLVCIATNSRHFHWISQYIKYCTFLGILSLLLI